MAVASESLLSRGRALITRPIVRLLDLTPSSVALRLQSDSRAARLLRPFANVLLPGQPTAVLVRSGVGQGIRLLIKPREEKYYWTGAHEPEVQRALARELAPGMTVWDVGAHIGFFTVLAARRVGGRGRAHAFEPNPENRSRLVEAVAMNDLQNVVVHDLALAGRSGSAPLYGHRFTTNWSLLEERGDATAHEVTCVTIDELACSMDAPDLIKIDAEGAELDVLRGGVGFLVERRPVLVVEFTTPLLVDDARRILHSHMFEQLAERHWLLRPEVPRRTSRGGRHLVEPG
jgi:FkbM family methyltransferase